MAARTPVRITPEQMAEQQRFIDAVRALPGRPQCYHIVTYGCQMNAHDSEKLAGMLEAMGLTEAPVRDEADLVLFNTCCVRDNAERRALGNITWLKEVRRQRPQLMIAVCGCMIQEPGMAERILKQYPFVDLAFGTGSLHRFPELFWQALHAGQTVLAVEDTDVIAEGVPVRRLRHEAAYVTIMYGCDNYCSYCIVPYVRGHERSRRAEDILREVEQLRDSGVREIMLLGQNVNSYAGEGGFPGLLRRVDALGVERIRFMTSHPKDLSDELIAAMAECPHVLPQFHLPVQSGSDEILRSMNRRYTRARYLERVDALRRAVPGIGLTTDVIVGYPGETEAQFADTLSLVEEVGYDSAFTFIYSPRVGTRAAALPGQITPEVATERIQRLIAVQERRQREMQARFVGQEELVLVEGLSKRSDRAVSGKGRHGISITAPGGEADIGQVIPVRVTGLKNNTLTAERLVTAP